MIRDKAKVNTTHDSIDHLASLVPLSCQWNNVQELGQHLWRFQTSFNEVVQQPTKVFFKNIKYYFALWQGQSDGFGQLVAKMRCKRQILLERASPYLISYSIWKHTSTPKAALYPVGQVPYLKSSFCFFLDIGSLWIKIYGATVPCSRYRSWAWIIFYFRILAYYIQIS